MTGSTIESYTVKLKDGKEIGPVPLEAVWQMLDQGVIDGDTPIRVGMERRIVFADQIPPVPKPQSSSPPPTAQKPVVRQHSQPTPSLAIAEPTKRHHAIIWSVALAAIAVLVEMTIYEVMRVRAENAATVEMFKRMDHSVETTKKLLDSIPTPQPNQ